MAEEIRQPFFECFEVFGAKGILGRAAVMLERAYGGDDHHRIRPQACLAAFDIEEFFRTEIRAETGLGNHVVAELELQRVAMMLLQPWAIFANGPPCTKAGVCSSVCTRFGCSASLSSAAIAPCALSWPAVTRLLIRRYSRLQWRPAFPSDR